MTENREQQTRTTFDGNVHRIEWLVNGLTVDERLARLTALEDALHKLPDLLLTQGHPEFGVECTACDEQHDATVINQPDAVTAILNAVTALRRLSSFAQWPAFGIAATHTA